jgi:hypothetical protein
VGVEVPTEVAGVMMPKGIPTDLTATDIHHPRGMDVGEERKAHRAAATQWLDVL